MTHELFVLRGLLAALKSLVITLDDDTPAAAVLITLITKAVSVLIDYVTELTGESMLVADSPTKIERLIEEGKIKEVVDYIAKLETKLFPLALAMCEADEAREDIKNILRA